MNSRIHYIIIKSLSGETTKEETDLLEKWIEEDPINTEEDRILRRLWESRFPYPGVVNSDEEFHKLWNRKDFARAERQGRSLGVNWGIILKIAAGLLLFLSIVWGWNSSKKDILVTSTNALVSKSNPRGQKSKIYLKDGTWVWLNSSSKIEYQEAFTEHDQRLLSLEGEAYFEVAKDSLKPFKVHAGIVDIEVFGTEFNVKTDKKAVSIALKEGSVKVTWEDHHDVLHEQWLKPGDCISVDKADGKFKVRQCNTLEIIGWKDGVLVFNEATFDEVKDRLQSWYDVDINVQGRAKAGWHYSGKFDNYVLDNVLKAIGFAEDFDYQIKGDTVNIIFN